MIRKLWLGTRAIAFTSCTWWLVPTSNAQTVSSADTDTELTQIIVTAQKRSEDIQSVPATVTAVSGRELDELHIVDPQQLTYVAPAVTFSVSTTPTSSGFSVRGIGTSTFSPGVEQSVSTVIDGVVYGQPQSTSALIDLDHVEILEGPQGMLFGKNASAGLVNLVTNNPSLTDTSVHLSGTIGTDQEYRGVGVFNTPLTDGAALRLVGFYNHTDGVITDVADTAAGKLNNLENYGFRAKILWEPAENWTILASGDYTLDNSRCCFYTTRFDTTVNAAFPLNGVVLANETLYGIVPGPFNTKDALDAPLGETRDADRRQYAGGSVQVDYKFAGGYDLTSITAYRSNDYLLDFDADQTALNLFDRDGGPQSYRQTSEELRLSSPLEGAFDYVAGLYYYRSVYDTELIAGGPFLAPVGIPGTVIADATANVTSIDFAAFAQGTYHISDAWRLIAGGRYTHDDLSLFYWNRSDPASQLPLSFFGQQEAEFTQSTDANNFSWRVGTQYDFVPGVMGYATVSRGYKGPGFSALPGALASQNQAVRPEIPMNYEIGVKSSLLDHRLILNGTAFIEDFKDFQAQVYDANTVPPAFRVTNAGELRSKGFELQAEGKPASNVTLAFSGAYVDAYYSSLKNISCYFGETYPTVTAPCVSVNGNLLDDASGNQLANAPRWSWNASARYYIPLPGSYRLDLESDYNWRSNIQFSANGDPNTVQGSYGLWNASIAFGPSDSKWDVRIFGKNLLNKHFAEFILPDAGDSKGGYAAFIDRDALAEGGITLEANF
jgi:iron complex outermembrane recepter protein